MIKTKKRLNICSISDTHGMHNEIDFSDYKDCDTFIHIGDWTRNRNKEKIQNIDFLKWVNSLDFKYKILVAGNHENFIEREPEAFKELLQIHCPDVIYLENETITIEGVKIFGSPFSNIFFNWAFMESETKLEKIWELIEEDTELLLTHGPAYKTLDLVNNQFSPNPYVGSKSLTERKKSLKKLKVHCSGHIHEAYGTLLLDEVYHVNPSFIDEHYQPVNKPINFSI